MRDAREAAAPGNGVEPRVQRPAAAPPTPTSPVSNRSSAPAATLPAATPARAEPPPGAFRRIAPIAGRSVSGAAAVGFACLAYSYLTLPDVRALRTSNPATTAFIELRAEEAH